MKSYFHCCCCAVALVVQLLLSLSQECHGQMERKKARRRGKHFTLAESFASVTEVHHHHPQAASATAVQKYKAGDYYVWNNPVWDFDDKENVPTTVIGKSRGSCVLLEDGTTAAGHCSWTLTVQEEERDGDKEEDEEKKMEISKLMVMGDVDSLAFDVPQTLAIVGGTGEYEAAAGEIDVLAVPGFILYDIFLD